MVVTRVLILTFTDIRRDPRPRRQLKWLRGRADVTVLSRVDPRQENVGFLQLLRPRRLTSVLRSFWLLLRLFERYYWDRQKLQMVEQYGSPEWDLVIAHEIRSVPLARAIAPNAKIMLDAHEFSPENYGDQFWWRLLLRPYILHLCRRYLPECNAVVTVSAGIAERYRADFGVATTTITNATQFHDLVPAEPRPGRVRLVHHGLASPSRRLGLMLDVMDHLGEGFELDLFLVMSPSFPRCYRRLERRAAGMTNVRLLPPAAADELVRCTNVYDWGVLFMPPVNFNIRHALPNKFFDYVQSRLAVASGPMVEVAHFVREYGLGIVVSDFEPATLAEAIRQTSTTELLRYKHASHGAARALSSDRNRDQFLAFVAEVLPPPRGVARV